VYAGRRPSLLQQDLKIGIAQRSELVDETDAGKELRVPRESLFDSGHADEHHAQAALIEDVYHPIYHGRRTKSAARLQHATVIASAKMVTA
jgi:hypothetical protein